MIFVHYKNEIHDQKQATKKKLAEIVFDTGYLDQQHFNKDFKLFTRLTPAFFLKSPALLQINDFLL